MEGPMIVREKMRSEKIAEITLNTYEEMVKIDIDVNMRIATIGGEWHSEGQEILTKDGSNSLDVWGVNFYPWREPTRRIVYVSLINLKPAICHKSMVIKDDLIRRKIKAIINSLFLADNETLSGK